MHDKYVSKANWSSGELKRIRKALSVEHGSGPRAEQCVRDELAAIKKMDVMGRVEIRRRLGKHARQH